MFDLGRKVLRILRISGFKNLSLSSKQKRFCFIPMKTSQNLLVSKDGSKFWWLPWFAAKNHSQTFQPPVYLCFSIFWNSVNSISCDWTGTPGQPLTDKDTWSCCSTENKCTLNEGDCDSNNDCEDGLFCGIDNCKSVNPGKPFPSGADCCMNLGKLQLFCHLHTYTLVWPQFWCTLSLISPGLP